MSRRPHAAPDPVLEAIAAHRTAYTRLCRATRQTDEMEAERRGRTVKPADELEWDAANEAEQEALERLEATGPETLAGARALLEYLRFRSIRDAWPNESSAALLSNVLRAIDASAVEPGELGLLYGIRAIARFCNLSKGQARGLARGGALPAFDLAGVTCARKSAIVAHMQSLENRG